MIKTYQNPSSQSGLVELIVLMSKYCPYSPKALKNVLELKEKYPIRVKPIDSNSILGRAMIRQYKITAVPTFLINGKVVFMGLPDKEEIEGLIRSYLRI